MPRRSERIAKKETVRRRRSNSGTRGKKEVQRESDENEEGDQVEEEDEDSENFTSYESPTSILPPSFIPQPSPKHPREKKQTPSLSLFLTFIILPIVLLGFCFYYALEGGTRVQSSGASHFISDFEGVKQHLSQGKGFATREKLLASLFDHIPKSAPERPLCIVAASSGDGAALFGSQLAKIILQNSSRALDLVGSDIAHLSRLDTMRRLQEAINLHFHNISTGSVVISDVNKLPAEDVTKVIWKFCDCDTAPFKHAVFVFTAQIPGLDDCGEEEATESSIRKYFEDLWGTKVEFAPFWVRAARLVISTSQCKF